MSIASTMRFFLVAALLFLVALSGSAFASVSESPSLSSSDIVLDHPNLLRKVSIDLNDTNISDAILYLAEKAELNVAISKNVTGRATLSFKNVTLKDAFDILLLSNDLACEKRGEVLYVMLAASYEELRGEKWAEPRQVKIFKLNYAKPTDVLTVLDAIKSKVGSIVVENETGTVVVMDTPEKIAQMKLTIASMDKQALTQVFELKYAVAKEVEAALAARLDGKGIGSIKADERSNRVIVSALPGRMNEVEKVIAELDHKVREVLIEAKIVKVTLTDNYDMGIDWQALYREGKKASVDFGMKFPVATTVTSFGRITAGILSKDDYAATLKLLKTVGETQLLSSPRIAAINNQEAKILVGTKEAYVTQTVTQGTSTTTTASAVTFIDVGVQLYVTPTINRDGFVTMKIRPEVSSVQRTLTTAAGDEIPIVETTAAETKVMVKDGYTIIIGGLIKNESSDTNDKVPLLGDVPLLGAAFRRQTKRSTKSELVVFLTPHIMTGDQSPAEADPVPFKPLRKVY